MKIDVCHIPNITSEASGASKKPRLTLEIKSTPRIIPFSNLRLKRDLLPMNATLSRESKFPLNIVEVLLVLQTEKLVSQLLTEHKPT